jgi:PIN domain nuclease of toxin-antitoxin system
MSSIVLDASALLAVLNQEPGAENLPPERLAQATISTVNLAEAHTKLVREGIDPDEAWEDVMGPIQDWAPFTAEQAKIAGSLAARTRSIGLSLGDRACLALGLTLKVPVYTTDRAWKSLKLGVRIHVIR